MAKISAQRQKKGKASSAAAWARMGPKKDRHVKKSSHGKFNTVAELVAHQRGREAVKPKKPAPKPDAPRSNAEADPAYLRERLTSAV